MISTIGLTNITIIHKYHTVYAFYSNLATSQTTRVAGAVPLKKRKRRALLKFFALATS